MSSGKKRVVSVCILLFWIIALLQVPWKREDWPFTYYGMYSGRVGLTNYSFYQTQFLSRAGVWRPAGELLSFNRFRVKIEMEKNLDSSEEPDWSELTSYIRCYLHERAKRRWSVLEKLDPSWRFRVVQKRWNEFQLANRHRPDEIRVLYEWKMEKLK